MPILNEFDDFNVVDMDASKPTLMFTTSTRRGVGRARADEGATNGTVRGMIKARQNQRKPRRRPPLVKSGGVVAKMGISHDCQRSSQG